MNKTIIIGIMFLLLVSNVSAIYKFGNPNKESFTIKDIHSAKEEYKAAKALDKCSDKDKVWQTDKCLDKYFYKFNSYIVWMEVYNV